MTGTAIEIGDRTSVNGNGHIAGMLAVIGNLQIHNGAAVHDQRAITVHGIHISTGA